MESPVTQDRILQDAEVRRHRWASRRLLPVATRRYNGSGILRCGAAALLGFLCFLLFPSGALAQSSLNSISFQGVLNGANGQPLPNGNYTLVFRFYDSPGTNQWRYATTNLGVAVAGGVASTAIAVDPTIFDGTTRYLGITVPGFNGGQELTPRVLVTAVPYAIISAGVAGRDVRLSRPSDGALARRIGSAAQPTEDLVIFSSGGESQMRFVSGGLSSEGFGFYMNIDEATAFAGQRPPHPAVRTLLRIDRTGSVGINTDTPRRHLDVNGSTRTRVLEIVGGSDLAEPFDVTAPAADTPIVPGMVMVIDRERDGKLTPCARAYDTAVAGILSGAKGLQPGMVMKAEGQPHAAGEHPLAMTGRVWCLADAAHGPIQRGDRLTTSPTVGHAMKAADEARAPGAVIGKALSELREGQGLVLVLVNLQ